MFALFLIPLLVMPVYAETIPDYNKPYSPIFTDKEIYTWTDKVLITVIAPSWNSNRHAIDSIGNQDGNFIKISTSDNFIEPYKLTETDPNSGVFTGEIILTGFEHDIDGDRNSDVTPRTSGSGPTNGFLAVERDGGITISFEFADGVVLTHSALISWNIGAIEFTKPRYLTNEPVVIRVIDADMNLNPELLDSVQVEVSSDSDIAGVTIDAIETSEFSGVFEATVSFTQNQVSSGNRLFALPEDTLYAEYDDKTLPEPYSIQDNQEITVQSKLESEIHPLDRIVLDSMRLTNSLGVPVDAPTNNEQIQVVETVQNNQNYNQKFTYVVQITDEQNVVTDLSWIVGQLSPNQTLELSRSWTPLFSGNYTVETFVWDSLQTSLPLSPTSKQNFYVQ